MLISFAPGLTRPLPAALLGGLGAGLVCLTWVLLKLRFDGILKHLGAAVARMATGDLRLGLEGAHGGELGRLEQGLKAMREALQQQFEEEIAAFEISRGMFQALLDHATVGIFLSSPEGIILKASSFGCALFGYETYEVEGQGLELILGGWAGLARVPGRIYDPASEDLAGIECLCRRRDRTEFWGEVTGTLLDPQQPGRGVIWTLYDISERKGHQRVLEARNLELEEARRGALAASEAKSNFLANMSHEIRTPLNGVLGTAELLSGTGLDAEQRDHLNVITSCGESLLALLNDILDLSKLEAGKLRFETIPFDPLHLAFDVVELFRAKAAASNLELLVECDPVTPPRLNGDPGRLRQVLANLMSNAIKFTAAGHVLVVLRVRAAGAGRFTLEIVVEDTGIGVAPEVLPLLFKPFSQADASTSRHYGGTGLGLALCRRILEDLGGRIDLASEPGRGSRFTLSLDLGAASSPAPFQPSPASLQGVRVLLVDDNPRNLVILCRQVEVLGARPVPVQSGPEALALLARDPAFELAVLDRQMPGMAGETLGQRIRANPALDHLGLLACTSSGQQGEAELFRASGFEGYLVKPVRMEVLARVLALVLDRKRSGVDGPLITRHMVAEGKSATDGQGQPLPPMQVLLVEDNEVNQAIAKKMLEDLGMKVATAGDGLQALAAFQGAAYDLIFMDCQMPGMDGYTATGRIRELEDGSDKHIPVIALTAHALGGAREQCLAAGMDDHLTKPLTRRSLEDALRRWGSATVSEGATAETPAQDPDGPGLDWARFREMEALFGDTPEGFQGRVLTPFIHQAEQLAQELREAAAAGDPKALGTAAHALKGASMNLGFQALGHIAQNLERSPASHLGAEPPLLRAFQDELDRVLGMVRKPPPYVQAFGRKAPLSSLRT